jgi:concanavalin A-like lectin/glucanase superfamily protein
MCKKLFVRASRASDFRSVIPTSRVLWLVAFAVVWTMIGYGGTAIGQVVGVDDPSDMADSSGDIKRIEAWVDEGNLNLTMTVYGVFAPSVEDTARGMTNRYYCHWLLDTDNNPDTGFSNSEYEGSATNLQTPIGADVVVQFGWRDGSTNGVNAYDPLTEDSLLEDYEYTIDGDTIHAVIPLADLGLTADDTIAVSAFQEGASGDWQVDWVESVVLPLRVVESVEPVNPGDAGLVLYYDFENDVNDMSGNGNDGVLLGDANVMDGLLVLDGDDDAVAIARIGGDEAVYSQISYGMWIYPTADLTGLEFSGGMNTSPWSAGAVHMKANNGVINVGISGLDGGDLVGTTIIDPNTWSHMALTISETNVSLYLNGQLEDSRDLAAPLADLILGSATLGGWENGDVQREMAGFMDDVVVYDRGLSANEIQWLAGLRPIAFDPGTDGLKVYYSLENDASDMSGNGFDGVLMGEPAFVDGIVGMALEVDGVDDYVDTGYTEDLAEWTISCWTKSPAAPDPAGSPAGPLHREKNYQINWNHSQDAFRAAVGLATANGWFGANFGDLEADTWYNLAGSYDGEDLKAYKNGVLMATNSDPSGPTNAETNSLKLGRHAAAEQYFAGSVDEAMVYDRVLSGGEIMFLAGYMPDVTALGDAVQGDPNDGDWPGAETPDLAIDDDTATKYLHFKGFSQSTGIQVTPAVGATIVTGLTFTTANDAVERDPVAFELLGSNDGIDGSYTLIASGDIVDFAQDEAWPRFTKNETPIVFNNTVAYTTYKILITAVRDAASANSMQIAEIELAGIAVD